MTQHVTVCCWYAAFCHWINETTKNNNQTTTKICFNQFFVKTCQFLTHESSMLLSIIQICLCHFLFLKECMTLMQWNLRELVRWPSALTCRATGDFSSLHSLMLPLCLRNPCFHFPFSFTTSPQGHFKRQTTPLDLQQILFINMNYGLYGD